MSCYFWSILICVMLLVRFVLHTTQALRAWFQIIELHVGRTATRNIKGTDKMYHVINFTCTIIIQDVTKKMQPFLLHVKCISKARNGQILYQWIEYNYTLLLIIKFRNIWLWRHISHIWKTVNFEFSMHNFTTAQLLKL